MTKKKFILIDYENVHKFSPADLSVLKGEAFIVKLFLGVHNKEIGTGLVPQLGSHGRKKERGPMDQRGELSRMLEQLGETADEVAAALKASGVQGVRNTVQALNPVVRYVQSRIRLELPPEKS